MIYLICQDEFGLGTVRMKVMAISNNTQTFGNYHRVIKELEKGVNTTIYSGNRIVGVHNVGGNGFVKGMRIFEDGSIVRYSSLEPKNKTMAFNISGAMAGEVDKGLLSLKGGLVDAEYVDKNPDFAMTRKGIVEALKAHLKKIKEGLKSGSVIDITGKEI